MRPHDLPLGIVERGRLGEDRGGHVELADIVQQRAMLELLELGIGELAELVSERVERFGSARAERDTRAVLDQQPGSRGADP